LTQLDEIFFCPEGKHLKKWDFGGNTKPQA